MKIILFTSIVLLWFTTPSFPQPGHLPLSTVKKLFEAMETNDSTLAASLFTGDAMLYSVHQNKDGQSRAVSFPAQRLVEAFGQPKAERWSEPVWNEKIFIDGDLAVIWVDYAFYIDTTFSHCGVDVFQLIRSEGEWKIFTLTDTRRKSGCEIPEEIKKAYE